MKKHFFFDLDNTICESRTLISNDVRNLLNKLQNVYVISGAARETMEKQLTGVNCTILAQSGNDTELWQNNLMGQEKGRIFQHIKKYDSKEEYGDLIEDRGSQLVYSFVGHHAPLELKKKFDPNSSKRKAVLAKHPFIDDDLMVAISGSTSIDYLKKGGTKGKNLAQYMQSLGLKKEECVYFGDAWTPEATTIA